MLQSERRLAKAYKTQVDWMALDGLDDPAAIAFAAGGLLEMEAFAASTEYDALNRPISMMTPDASEIRPTYNEAGLLDKVEARVRGAAAWTPFVDNIDYDAKGQREKIVYAGGATYTEYEYDEQTFRLKHLVTTRVSGNKTLQDLSYTYDPVGNITEIRDAAQQEVFFDGDVVLPKMAYVYDALYRLTSATGREHGSTGAYVQPDQNDAPVMSLPHANNLQALRNYTEDYEYDAVGNILRMIHDSGAPETSWTRRYDVSTTSNRLLRTSVAGDMAGQFSALYGYDEHGNMTSMPHLATVGWNHRDEMVSADKGGGGIVYFTYDAGGERVRKVYEHNGLIEERIYLGGWEIYRKRLVSAPDEIVLERETLHMMDGVRRIAMVETKTIDEAAGGAFQVSTVTRFQLGNHLGSAALEVDAGGMVISYEEYHPYGTTAFWSASSAVEVSRKRYRYTGKEKDEETGLYYHGARYYASWLGRWTAADPAGLVDGVNLYRYARVNPVMFSDPSGTDSVSDAEKRLRADAHARYEALKKEYNGSRQNAESAARSADAEVRRVRALPLTDQLRDPDAADRADSAAYDLRRQIMELDEAWSAVELKYHTFAFPNGGYAPNDSIAVGPSRQQRYADFNAAANALKGAPLTSIVLATYAVYASIKNGNAGPLTAEQQGTFEKIVTVGPAVEGAATGLAAGAAAYRGRAPTQRSRNGDTVRVFRGVNESHAHHRDALQGTAKPNRRPWQFWKPSATPYEHNSAPDGTRNSPYTSWTTDPDVAMNYALRPGGGGVVLQADIPRSRLVKSPNLKEVQLKHRPNDVRSEAEVLVRGAVRGAKVRRVP